MCEVRYTFDCHLVSNLKIVSVNIIVMHNKKGEGHSTLIKKNNKRICVSVCVSCMFHVCSTCVSCMFPVCFKYVSCMFHVCFIYVSRMFHLCSTCVSCMFQGCFEDISKIFSKIQGCFKGVSMMIQSCFMDDH